MINGGLTLRNGSRNGREFLEEAVPTSIRPAVGHGFNPGVGAKLSGVEKRIDSFVLMVNQYSLHEYLYDEQNASMGAQRKKEGDAAVEAYLQKSPWHDSRPFAERSAPAAVFLQYGRNDKPLPESAAKLSHARFDESKRMEFYESGYELNATARWDRDLKAILPLQSNEPKVISVPKYQ